MINPLMSDKSLTLTIVIPAFNEEDQISGCLAAIAAQTVKADEVILVDNNSRDQTARIARRFPFVKVVREHRQGVLFARNKGFDAAGGDLIGRIDADTLLPPDWVATAKAIYRRHGSPGMLAVTSPSGFRNSLPLFWYAMHRLTYFWPARLMLGHSTLVGSNMFITRELWHKVRPSVCQRVDMHEDMDLALHAHQTGAEVVFDGSLRASIMARRMLRRAILYPRMMRNVWRAAEHSLATPKQPINQYVAGPEYRPAAYKE